MPLSTSLYTTIKSLDETIPKSFIFKKSFETVSTVINIILDDIKAETEWYDSHKRESQKILATLRQLLRFIKTRIDVSDVKRKELVYLRKALIYTCLNQFREEFLLIWAEIKYLIFNTELALRLRETTMTYFGANSSTVIALEDFKNACKGATSIYKTLQEAFPNHEVSKVGIKCEEILPNEDEILYPMFTIFENKINFEAAYSFSEYVLSLDPQTDRFLSKVDLESIKIGKFDIRGSFGDILHTNLKYIKSTSTTEVVSIQIVHKDTICKVTNEGKGRLAGEISVLIHEKSEALINIVGYTIHWGAFCIALEHIDRTLSEVLHGKKNNSKLVLSSEQTLCVFEGVVEAVVFLHERGIVHGDIRPSDIFIPASLVSPTAIKPKFAAKLGNFNYGTNHFEPRWMALATEEGLQYRSPEVLDCRKATGASDVYSLAICLWESVQDNRKPFDHLYRKSVLSKSKLIRSIKNGDRPTFKLDDKGQPKEPSWCVGIITKSWVAEAWERPLAEYWKSYIKAAIKQAEIDVEAEIADFALNLRRASTLSLAVTHIATNTFDEIEAQTPKSIPPSPRPRVGGHMTKQRGGSIISLASFQVKEQRGSMTAMGLGLYHKASALAEEVQSEKSEKSDADEEKEDRKVVEKELREFYNEQDPLKVKDERGFQEIVTYCQKYGLEAFSENLENEYGQGLKRFREEEEPTQPTKLRERKTSRMKMNFTSVFLGRKKKGPKKKPRLENPTVKAPSEVKSPLLLRKQGSITTLSKVGSRQSVFSAENTSTRYSVTSFIKPPDKDLNL